MLTFKNTYSRVVCCKDQCSSPYFYILFIPSSNSFYLNFRLIFSPVSALIPVITYPYPYLLFNSAVVPSATTFPLLIINMRSERHSDSSMLWVVINIVLFRSRSRKIIFHVYNRILASIPVVGSSKITNFGFPIKLMAKDNLLRIPPENVLTLPDLF